MKLIQHSLAIMLALFVSMPAWANDGATDADPKVVVENTECEATDKGPKAVIENTVCNIIAALDAREDKSILTDKDRDAIRQAIEGRFDYRLMSRRSLGKPWKKLSDEKRVHFLEVYRELLERSYGNRLAEYKGQIVKFANAEIKKKKKYFIAVVKSKVIDGDTVTHVDYSMRETKTGWQVYDIKIEGTSMVNTKRKEYKSMLSKRGFGYEQLLKALEDQLARLKAKDAS